MSQTVVICSQVFIVSLCSDLISSVFPALSWCLLHLWSHSEGWCRTESVPLHVGDTQYVHPAKSSTHRSLQYILCTTQYTMQCTKFLCLVCLQTTVHGLRLQRGRTWTLWRTCSTHKANSNSLLWHSLSPMHEHTHSANKHHGHRAVMGTTSTVRETRHHGGLVIRCCDLLCKSCTYCM